ncbi:winged helix DNA-binding protein [Nonomuraea polychroma]|uniref:Winged helix DNA-binding protein n=1 Tax=Nonomuraea polychroma TaxID=46176 RepID=A0A438ML01_9ACTN|nr:winged helix DNA-binding domain-containing protein [Nonomuraea polychroma]RVX46424.1 winged helix DNA-binding protein [Nonomuraea polychroma]
MTQLLSRRGLNRATLARQFLLERVELPALEAIEHLAGMQSQAPLAPYVGLWTRLAGFRTAELSALTVQRAAVRAQLMRNTVHLVSARDCLSWHRLFESVHSRDFAAHFGGRLNGVDQAELLGHARTILDDKPRTRAELGQALAKRWPDIDPKVLAYAATHHLAVVQVPPRGMWGQSGRAEWSTIETFLGRRPSPESQAEDLVRRYLNGYGPASVADAQRWSGLTRLREIIERLDLVRFRDEEGRELFDLPNAPRPDPDTPAPPRFLPEYDNLLLSHADRSRVITDNRQVPLPPGNGARTGTLLVDGIWRGIWSLRAGEIHVEPFTPLSSAERDAVEPEAEMLRRFLDSRTA